MTAPLEPLPDFRERLIVVGGSVRKNVDTLRYFLASLDAQDLPPRTTLLPIFVADWPATDPAEQLLREWVQQRGGEVLRGMPSGVGDFADTGLPTHQWSSSAMARVGANKDKVLRRARELKADGCWLVDADLIMDRTTLASLLSVDKPIACAVYWTHWNRQATERAPSFAGPQVWLTHPYGLDGRGFEAGEFRERLVNRTLTQVWGQGACSLIRKDALAAGVSFARLPDVTGGGLMDGEDRHFCIRAERSHIPMFADPWPDIFHVYHLPEDLQWAAAVASRLATPHPERAALGDLVSLKLEALEPMPQADGRFVQVPPQFVRGRLGQIALAPELEEAVYGLTRGQVTIVPTHFPLHAKVGYFRGRRRLIRVTLIDAKPFCYAPVLEDELWVGPKSGRYLDKQQLTPPQEAALVEATR